MDSGLGARLRQWRKREGLTQAGLAAKLGLSRSSIANFETGVAEPTPEVVEKLNRLGMATAPEVGPPLIPASQLLVPITYIGAIAASNPVNWTDPFESETFEFVPPEMGDARGRFACRIESDSMMPLLEPLDVCVFQRTDVPKIGHVILFRSHERLVTVKQLKHNGVNYLLHPLNPTYDDAPANGQMLGFLVGIVRERGTQRLTVFDSTGILP